MAVRHEDDDDHPRHHAGQRQAECDRPAEEAIGRNAIAGGFQGQRMWTDYMPNGDFAEAITNSSFNWNGKKEPLVLATENDTLNGVAMLFEKLLNHRASIFADVRSYWSPEAVELRRRTQTEGRAGQRLHPSDQLRCGGAGRHPAAPRMKTARAS